jgi:hypothetical protein
LAFTLLLFFALLQIRVLLADGRLALVSTGNARSARTPGAVGGYLNDFYAREFWRFVNVQQRVAELAKTAIDFPPMQAPASFNLDAVKAQVDEAIKSQSGQ